MKKEYRNLNIIFGKIMIFLIMLSLLAFTIKVDTKAQSTYVNPEREFRAVWISNLVADISSYSTESAFKTEMIEVLTVMEHYNLNALIFHIRTHNNALYDSELNPVASWWSKVNFNNFDPLEWLISECHARGIEFHAWMNPYRVSSSLYGEALPASNPASNPANLLTYNSATILNPGLPNVRQFLIDTVMEVIEKYDVDAIHFDDYFYMNLGANGALTGTNTILNEPDQTTFVQYAGNYSTTSASDKANWRREQINIFIEGLYNSISTYNTQNNRYVQLGISPTGIYKNGNGVVTYDTNGHPITSGSDTGGQTHYSSYLFCDSLKWAVEGWIDYILPQSYWATDHSVASYYKVMGWWDKVVKNLDVSLYSGIGLYMAASTGTTKWQTDPNELLTQLTHITTLENVKGASIYVYKHLKAAYNGGTTMPSQQLANLGTNAWSKKVLVPEISTFSPVTLNKVTNLNVVNNTLTWDRLAAAKFYAIYRSATTLTFSADELVDVIGNSSTSTVTWTDTVSGSYSYGIRPVSRTNTLGLSAIPLVEDNEFTILTDTGATQGTEVTHNNGVINASTIQVGFNRFVFLGAGSIDASRLNYNWTSSDETVATISIYGTITAIKIGTTTIRGVYKNNPSYWGELIITVYDKYTVIFMSDDQILSTQSIVNGNSAIAPVAPDKAGYQFTGWDQSFNNVNSNLTINALYELIAYTVIFKNYDNTTLSTQSVTPGSSAIAPTVPLRTGYTFAGWDQSFNNVTTDLTITALYEILTYTVIFKDNAGATISTQTINYGASAIAPTPPIITGYQFTGWNQSFNNVTTDLIITALYEINTYTVVFKNYDNTTLSTQTIAYGSPAIAPTVPQRTGYTFAGWDKSFNNVTTNLTITALYDILTYTVIFKDNSGATLSTQTINYGSSAIAPTPPVITGYNFTGWNQSYNNVTTNLTITALYEVSTYTVIFKNYDNTTLSTQTINYGASAIAPTVPQRTGYTFTGWDKSFNNVTSDLTITALFEILTYTVIFKDNLGVTLSTQTIEHGTSATAPTPPVITGYQFTGWSQVYNNVTTDLIITALYEVLVYTVIFKDSDNTILSTQTIEFGNAAIAPTVPNKEGYAFNAWDNDFSSVTSDLVIVASYREIIYSIKVLTSLNANGVVEVSANSVTGSFVEGDYGYKATLTATNQNAGEFMFWVLDGKIISLNNTFTFTMTKNHTFTAYFSNDTEYGVAFVDSNLTLVDFVLVSANTSATTSKTPLDKPGYTFNGWPSVDNVVENQVVYATYSNNLDLLTVTVVNGVFAGTTDTTKEVFYGNVVTIVNNDSSFTYWMINDVIVSYNNEFTFSIYHNTVVSAVLDGTELVGLAVFVNKPIVDNDNNKIAFFGHFNNPFNVEIIEIGVVYILGDLDPIESIGASAKRIFKYSNNNEFSVIFPILYDETVSLRFYAVTKNIDSNTYNYTYSNLETYLMEESGNNLEFELDGGNFYAYASREEMVTDFVNDYNAYFNSSVTAATLFSGTFTNGIYPIFTSLEYGAKWSWLKDYIIEVCEANNYNDLAGLLSGTPNLWRSNVWAFMNRTVLATWPYSFNYTSQSINDGFWYKIIEEAPSTYVQGEVYILPTPMKLGFTFAGWYLTPDLNNDPITQITADSSGNKKFYAKWN